MMGHSKPLASLSSGLLARKGGARPAMRPQTVATLTTPAQGLEDLGWNDMGGPAAAVSTDGGPASVPTAEPAPVPPVLVEREALAQQVETPSPAETPDADADADADAAAVVAVRPVSVATATRLRRETTRKGKAAFTLRLDQERHLRLRLASTLAGRSAQALVTRALDDFLATLPEVEALVAQLPQSKSGR